MTFHSGNGVTLTKEEENLPEEEKQKLIRQKEDLVNYERYVVDDLKDMVDRGDASALAAEKAKMDKKLGGAKDYGLGDIDGSKAQEAVDLVNGMHADDVDEAMRLVGGDEKSGTAGEKPKTVGTSAQQTEYGQGAFGTLKNEDFTQYRKDKAARQAAAREARRASDEAMAAKRKELLASGRYFDNGRGQIMLKKQYRQYATGTDWRHRHLRTAADDGSGMLAIRGAGDDAFNAALDRRNDEKTQESVHYSRSAIQANRLAAEERKAANAEAGATSAKAKLSVFDGFAAALDALNTDAENAEDNVVSVWGGKDEKGRDARWKYDDQGRVIGQADPRQVVRGKRLGSGGVQQTEGNFRKGFVDPVVIKAINSQLQKRGANYAVTGIMARQAYGAIGKPVEGSKPMFYIQGLRNDGTQFGQYMTIDDVYRWGVENYRAANGNLGNPQKFAAEALGGYDPEGVLGMSEKERIAMMNNETKRSIAEQKSNDAAKREMGERIKQMTNYLKDLNNIEIYPDQGSEEIEAEKKNIREQLAQARREYFQRPGATGQPAPTQTGAPAPQGGGVTNPQGKPVAENVNVPEAGAGEPVSGGVSTSAAAQTATNLQGGTANGGDMVTLKDGRKVPRQVIDEEIRKRGMGKPKPNGEAVAPERKSQNRNQVEKTNPNAQNNPVAQTADEDAEFEILQNEMNKIGINHNNSEKMFFNLTDDQKEKWRRYIALGLKRSDRQTREMFQRMKDKFFNVSEKIGDAIGEAYNLAPNTMD